MKECVFQVPLAIVIFCILFLLFVVAISAWFSPEVNGVGVLIFFSGVPVYFAAKLLSFLPCTADLLGEFQQKKYILKNSSIKDVYYNK